MSGKAQEELFNELFRHLEAMETQSAAMLQLLKDKGLATDEKLAPYLERAGNASEVKWRAARVRMERLLSSAGKEVEQAAEKEAEQTSGKNAEKIAKSTAEHAGDEKPVAKPSEQIAENQNDAGEKKIAAPGPEEVDKATNPKPTNAVPAK